MPTIEEKYSEKHPRYMTFEERQNMIKYKREIANKAYQEWLSNNTEENKNKHLKMLHDYIYYLGY